MKKKLCYKCNKRFTKQWNPEAFEEYSQYLWLW